MKIIRLPSFFSLPAVSAEPEARAVLNKYVMQLLKNDCKTRHRPRNPRTCREICHCFCCWPHGDLTCYLTWLAPTFGKKQAMLWEGEHRIMKVPHRIGYGGRVLGAHTMSKVERRKRRAVRPPSVRQTLTALAVGILASPLRERVHEGGRDSGQWLRFLNLQLRTTCKRTLNEYLLNVDFPVFTTKQSRSS